MAVPPRSTAALLGLVLAVASGALSACGEPGAVRVYVGYADSAHPAPSSAAFPKPWAGAPHVRFVGGGAPFDAGAIRIDNPTAGEVEVRDIRVEAAGRRWSPWGTQHIPAGWTLILTQPGPGAFRTASTSPCLDPANDVPRLSLTVAGRSVEMRDTGRVLTTGGRNLEACPGQPNGSRQWTPLGSVPLQAPAAPGTVSPRELAADLSLALVMLPVVLGLVLAGLHLLAAAFRGPGPASPRRPHAV